MVDANVLLYAVNTSADRHEQARGWLDRALSGQETIGFAWVVLLAFVRVSTRHGIFPRPLQLPQALATVGRWLDAPPSVVVEPTSRHLSTMSTLLADVGAGGNLVNDAHLAALAVEHGATVISWDNDFGRFPGVSWTSPPSA